MSLTPRDAIDFITIIVKRFNYVIRIDANVVGSNAA